jgi:hypothetical protein
MLGEVFGRWYQEGQDDREWLCAELSSPRSSPSSFEAIAGSLDFHQD